MHVRQKHIHPLQRDSCRLLNLCFDSPGHIAVVLERHSRIGCSHRGLDNQFVQRFIEHPLGISVHPLGIRFPREFPRELGREICCDILKRTCGLRRDP